MTELLSPAVRALLESDAVATVVTLGPDGSPHVSSAWVGLEDGEIVIGTLDDQRRHPTEAEDCNSTVTWRCPG